MPVFRRLVRIGRGRHKHGHFTRVQRPGPLPVESAGIERFDVDPIAPLGPPEQADRQPPDVTIRAAEGTARVRIQRVGIDRQIPAGLIQPLGGLGQPRDRHLTSPERPAGTSRSPGFRRTANAHLRARTACSRKTRGEPQKDSGEGTRSPHADRDR